MGDQLTSQLLPLLSNTRATLSSKVRVLHLQAFGQHQHQLHPLSLLNQWRCLSSDQNLVANRVAFYHAAMCLPPPSTWCAAIDAGFLTTWPDLTSAQVRRHPLLNPDDPRASGSATGESALHQTSGDKRHDGGFPPRQITAKTKPPISSRHQAPQLANQLPSEHISLVDCQLITGQIATDLPGRFLVPSSRGNSYSLIVYDYEKSLRL